MHQSPHKRPRGYHDGPRPIAQSKVGLHPDDLVILDQNPHRVPLEQMKARGMLQHPLQTELIGLLVALGPWRLHARALPCVEHPELDPRGVRVLTHHPPERINLPHHVPFGQAPDSRIARHLPDGVQVLGQNPGVRPQPSGRQTRLHSRMPRTQHENVKCLRILVHAGHVPRGT